MSDLMAVAFDEPHTAEKARLDLLQLENKELADLEEAVIVVVDSDGKARFHHTEEVTVPIALAGGFAGMLVGLILINPLIAAIGGLSGAVLGTVYGVLKDVGIDEGFIKRLSEELEPGSSALFVVTRKGKPETIIKALDAYRGKVLQTSLSHRDENKLRAALQKVDSSGLIA